jgi:hypothetical protein
MARMTIDQRMANIHAEALKEFDTIQEAVRDERLQCLQDRRFYSIAGAQWEGPLREQYENKPKFEVNKIMLAVTRIFNEYRNNRITVDYVPRDGKPENNLAETCDKLYRADEMDSSAEEAYDNAFEEAVGGGFGAWRLRTVYEDEEDDENEKQRIIIEPIFDADSSVFFDLNAKRQDKADARRCFVLTAITRDAYIEQWDDDPATWPKEIHQYEFDWATPDVVYIAEYYRVEDVNTTIRIFQNIAGEEERYTNDELDDEKLEEFAAIGTVEVRQKRVKKRRVHKYLMSGSRILEDLGFIAGKEIPIVPVYGKRWFVDNIERMMGHVRLAKDAQRLKNMQLSKLGEISAYSSIEKPIMTPEQVAGHQVMWSEDNIRNFPYLLINPITGPDGAEQVAGPAAYTRSAQIPPSLAALLQVTEQDIQDILGNAGQQEQIVSNISGKAVELIQNRMDMQTYIYMSNMAKAVRRSGEIWLSMAKDVYIEEGRKMKGIGSQAEIEQIQLMTPTISAEGEMINENDLSNADFDVVVDVGPSSSSKRQAVVRSLLGMMQITQDPETLQVLGAMAMMNMEGEGISEVRDYFRKKLVNMGVVKPTKEEEEAMAMAMANQQQDPNAIFLQAAAEEARAKAEQARAEVVNTLADADYKAAGTAERNAKTVEILAKVEEDDQRLAIDSAKGIQDILGRGPRG